MADFKKQGGSLTGREERYDGFEGEPRAVSSALGGSSTTGTTGTTGSGMTGTGSGMSGTGTGMSGTGTGMSGTGMSGSGTGSGTGMTGSGTGMTGSGTGTGMSGSGTTGAHSSNLENKLDPRVDSTSGGNYGSSGTRDTIV